jgi:hypothetical protein
MPQHVLRLGVLAMRRPPVTRWGPGQLRPTAVLTPEPATPPNTLLLEEEGTQTWYLGGRDLTLWSGDTAHHRSNLNSGRAQVWVALRGNDPARAEVVCLTADPYEGEGLAGDLDLIVEAVPMPESVRAAVAAFVAEHHVDIEFKKRKRSPTHPDEADARPGPRILQPADKWESRRGRRQEP